MAKTNTVLIKLVSSADTGFFYVTKKNPRTKTNKLELKKFDPVARKHVVFEKPRSNSLPLSLGKAAFEFCPCMAQTGSRPRVK